MKVIIEKIEKMKLDHAEGPGLSEDIMVRYRDRVTKTVDGFEVDKFSVNLNKPIPTFYYSIGHETVSLRIATDWDKNGSPIDHINRIWVDGTEVFNMEEFINRLHNTDSGEPVELMYFRNKRV